MTKAEWVFAAFEFFGDRRLRITARTAKGTEEFITTKVRTDPPFYRFETDEGPRLIHPDAILKIDLL